VSLLLLLYLALKTPSVQNYITQRAASFLSEKIDSRFSVGHIELEFFNRLQLREVYLEGLDRDTLAYIGLLEARLDVFAPLRQEIGVEGIQLEDAYVNLKRGADSLYNFQFLVDAFATDAPVDTSAGPPWTFDLNALQLRRVRVSIADSIAHSNLFLNTQKLDSRIKSLDLAAQKIDIRSITGADTYFNYSVKNTTPPAIDTLEAGNSAPLLFPYTGWDLTAGTLQLENVDIGFDDFNQVPLPQGQFDPSHLHIDGLNLQLEAFAWDSTQLIGQIEQLAFREMNGFDLQALRGELLMTDQEISIQKLELQTPLSRVPGAELSIQYPSFSSLPDFVDQGRFMMDFSPSFLAPQDLAYWTGPIPYLKKDISEQLEFRGRAEGRVDDIRLQSFEFRLGAAASGAITGSVKGLPDIDQLQFDAQLKQLRVAYQPFMQLTENLPLPEGLNTWKWVEAEARAQGRINNIRLSALTLRTDKTTFLSANARVRGLPDTEQLTFEAEIEDLITHMEELQAFAPDSLPPTARRLERIHYQGRASGSLYAYQLNGRLGTGRGTLVQDMSIEFNEDFSNATYSGNGSLKQFELGKLLGDTTTFGPLTLSFELDGKGLTLEDIDTKFDIKASALRFRGYTYTTFETRGHLQQKDFDGYAYIDGPHMSVSLDGYASLKDTLPVINMSVLVDTLNLYELGYYPEPLALSAKLDIATTGNTLDDIEGQVTTGQLYLSNDRDTYQTDTILFKAQKQNDGKRALNFRADFANASLKGDYKIEELSDIVIEFVDGFFPVRKLLSPEMPEDDPAVSPMLASHDFELGFYLSEPLPLINIFVPELTALDTAALTGKFNSEQKILQLNLDVPRMEYNGLAFDSINLNTQGNPERLRQTAYVQRVSNESQELIRAIGLEAAMYEDSLFLDLEADRRPDSPPKFALHLLNTARNDRYRLHINPPFLINRQKWSVPDNNRIIFSDSFLEFHNFMLERDQQAIVIQSQDKPADADFAPIRIDIRNFQLSEIARLIDYEESFLDGVLEGSTTLSRPDTSYLFDANLRVEDLTLSEAKAGDLQILANTSSDNQSVDVSLKLAGKQNDVDLSGKYILPDNQLDFELDAPRIQMQLLDFFAMGFIDESQGRLGARLDIGGSVTLPEVEGELSLDSASTVVEYLQSRYLIKDHTIKISKNKVDFGNMELTDPTGSTAIFSGDVRHENFENIRLDLSFDAPSFQVLNTKSSDNDLFYGKVVVDINADITGLLENPRVNVNATTLSGTRLTALPLSEQTALTKEDYIIYGTPAEYRADTLKQAQELYQQPNFGFNLLLNLTLTSDAQIIVLIDPATGDQLKARGVSNLIVEMDQAGNLSTTGEIRVVSGAYYLNYEGLVKRTFNIQEGSEINLPGNPLNARFDITASYETRVSPFELIRGQAQLEGDAASIAKRRQPFLVLMMLDGTLAQPAISFDIQLKDQQASPISNTIIQKLAQIRENQSELNKQVFGLLLFNSFIIESGSPVNLASASENIALNSVSNFLSNQLNQLADKYVKGVELDIGLESYTSNFSDQSSASTTEVQLGLSKALFDDRLVVQVGSNLGIDEENNTGQTNTNLTGSFLLEYKLDEDGRYRLRVFRRPDYDLFNEANAVRTGAGIIYKRSFGSPRPAPQDSLKKD
jgi:hypothetical protein